MEKPKLQIQWPIIHGIPENPTSAITYSICSDGLYMTKKLLNGHVTMKVDGVKSSPAGREYVKFLPRKIPIRFYWKIVEFFKAVNNHFKTNLEAFILICWDKEKERYHFWVPPHKVSGGSVQYDLSNFNKVFKNSFIVCDTHSHNLMGAFWSTTDNNDDNRDRFAMVIGKTDNMFPEHKIRFSSNKHIDCNIGDVFTDTDNNIDDSDLNIKQALAQIDYTSFSREDMFKESFNVSNKLHRYGGPTPLYEFFKRKTLKDEVKKNSWEI